MISILIKEMPFKIPSNWNEVTTGQYLEMNRHRDELNTVRMLSIFIGIDYDSLQGFSMDDFETNIIPLLSEFNNTIKFGDLKIKGFVTIKGKDVVIPVNLNEETFGQKILAHEKINEAIKKESDLIELFPYVASVYLMPNYYGEKFTDKKIKELEQLILQEPITEIYPVANFFLSRLIN